MTMGELYRVENLQAALNLASEFKDAGKYNLFRGQGKNWNVVPSAGRLSEKRMPATEEVLKRLYYFFETNGLTKYTSNIDWFFAVAQHYGLPTNYIDFSTSPDVAAYFATHSKSNRPEVDCVIICLNESDFIDFVQFTKVLYEKDKVVPPYIAKIDVDNLWRLQAQSGCFLFTPYVNIEQYYHFDRIIFPHSEPFGGLTSLEIYPARKSELEILLDHFFNTEMRIEGQVRMRRFTEEMKMPYHEIPPLDYENRLSSVAVHGSWKSKAFLEWIYPVTESWIGSTPALLIGLEFRIRRPMILQIEQLKKDIMTYFEVNNIQRNSIVKFQISGVPKLSRKTTIKVNRSCERIWDGTRNLPYSIVDIAHIIAKYICLEIHEDKYDHAPDLTEEPNVCLEMVNEYGSITRCHATPSKIVTAFRSDIRDILVDLIIDDYGSKVLLHVNKADLIFDFHRLVELFKDELICYQVLYNSENDKPVIFYTPTQIKVIGYA
jgi:hypothetical protein